MAAEYDFQRRPNPKGDDAVQPLYPRIVNKGTIKMERLVQDIAGMSSFTPGDVTGVMALIEDRISYYLSEGHHVQLGDIGYFSAGLQARPVMDPKEIHSQTIFFGKVHLRVSPTSGNAVQVMWSVPNMVFGKVPNLAVRNVITVYWLFWRHILSLPAMIIAELRDF